MRIQSAGLRNRFPAGVSEFADVRDGNRSFARETIELPGAFEQAQEKLRPVHERERLGDELIELLSAAAFGDGGAGNVAVQRRFSRHQIGS